MLLAHNLVLDFLKFIEASGALTEGNATSEPGVQSHDRMVEDRTNRIRHRLVKARECDGKAGASNDCPEGQVKVIAPEFVHRLAFVDLQFGVERALIVHCSSLRHV